MGRSCFRSLDCEIISAAPYAPIRGAAPAFHVELNRRPEIFERRARSLSRSSGPRELPPSVFGGSHCLAHIACPVSGRCFSKHRADWYLPPVRSHRSFFTGGLSGSGLVNRRWPMRGAGPATTARFRGWRPVRLVFRLRYDRSILSLPSARSDINFRSVAIISRTNSGKPTLCFQPSLDLAFAGFPNSVSTSVGRK